MVFCDKIWYKKSNSQQMVSISSEPLVRVRILTGAPIQDYTNLIDKFYFFKGGFAITFRLEDNEMYQNKSKLKSCNTITKSSN